MSVVSPEPEASDRYERDDATCFRGEALDVPERIVTSPATGFFAALRAEEDPVGRMVEVGDVIGMVGDTDVRSPFAGHIHGLLVVPGERVRLGQAVAWLRVI